MTAVRGRLALVAGLAVAAAQAMATAARDLDSPPVGSWAAVSDWYERVGPAMAVASGLRWVALAGAGWIAVAAGLQIVASCSVHAGVRALADAVSPRLLHQLAHGAASLSLSAGLAAPVAGSWAWATVPTGDPPGTAVMVVVDEPPPATTSPAPPATPAPTVAPVGPGQPDEVVVRVGDSFWSLAADAIADAGGDPSNERTVAAYWERLIEANRPRLVAPGNADLVLPGQRLALPAVTVER